MTNEALRELSHAQTAYFESGATRSLAFKKQQLKKLKAAIQKRESEILDALLSDFGKPTWEGWVSEIGVVYSEIDHTLKNLARWSKPKRVKSPLMTFPSSSKVYREPMGRSFIIAPWNYPFQLVIAPLIPSIAAGNTILIKPSELTPNTAEVVAKLIADTFTPEHVAVVLGDGADIVPRAIDEYRPQHIFFTGSPAVGKIIAGHAAKYLIPTVLELGGKSPVIVDGTTSMKTTVSRILWGKFLNAGQTCIAPDYVLVQRDAEAALLEEMKRQLTEWYGENPLESPHLARVIHKRAFDRLCGMLSEGETVFGGGVKEDDLAIAPTIIRGVDASCKLMEEEIFGPILPILTYSSYDEVVSIVRQHPDPLALYIFTSKRSFERHIIRDLSFGNGAVNNTNLQFANNDLPFGGIRNSGSGSYHGQYGFEAFTHAKGMLHTGMWFDAKFKYPPYTQKALALIKKLI